MPGFHQRILAPLIIGSLPMASHALPEVIQLPLPAGPALVRQFIAQPGEFVELCAGLKQGLALTWTFSSGGPVDFNTHFHIADEVMYPERMTAISAAQGRLAPVSDQQFCWMWTNPTRTTLTIRIQLGP